MLKIDSRDAAYATILDLTGEIDIEAETRLKDEAVHGVPSGTNIIWNFSEVSNVSSTALGILLDISKEITRNGGTSRIVNISPEVLDVFQVHKVIQAFSILPDEKSALRRIVLDQEKEGDRYGRLFERLKVKLKGRMKLFRKGRQGSRETEPYTEVEASSLSMGGIFLKTGTTYDANTVLDIRLALPTGIFKPQVKLLAKVVWSADKESDGAPSKGMALSTLFIDEDERKKLENFLKKSA